MYQWPLPASLPACRSGRVDSERCRRKFCGTAVAAAAKFSPSKLPCLLNHGRRAAAGAFTATVGGGGSARLLNSAPFSLLHISLSLLHSFERQILLLLLLLLIHVIYDARFSMSSLTDWGETRRIELPRPNLSSFQERLSWIALNRDTKGRETANQVRPPSRFTYLPSS